MAKKKKAVSSSTRKDTRGYATTSSAGPASVSLLPINQTVAATSATGSTATSSFAPSVVFPPSVYEILEELLALLPPPSPPPPPSTASILSPVVLARRVGTIYDGLIDSGFTHDQIRAATMAGALSTLSIALDWLCVNLPNEDLPFSLVEPWVRESITNEAMRPTDGTSASTLTVLRPTVAAYRYSSTVPHTLTVASASVESIPRMEQLDVSVEQSNNTATLDKANHQDQVQNKAWLLERYQFEDEDDDCDDAAPPVSVTAVPAKGTPRPLDVDTLGVTELVESNDMDDGNTFSASNLRSRELLEEAHTEIMAPTATVVPSLNELRLTQLQLELTELQADANNEANNYMRSKHEIKALQQQIKNMRQQVQGLERKVKREASQSMPVVEPQTKETTPFERRELLGDTEGIANDVDDDDNNEGLFSMFTAIDDENNVGSKPSVPVDSASEQSHTTGVCIPADSIPPKWTGKIPRVYLEEWCRKERVSKPNFQKLPRYGCRLHVVLPKSAGSGVDGLKSITVEEAGPHDSYSDVQHFLATKVLYQINPMLPLYRLFPPFYRDLWLQWLEEKETDKANDQAILAESRRFLIDDIIQCIPKPLRSEKIGTLSSLDIDTTDSPIVRQNAPSWNEAVAAPPKRSKTATEFGLRLQQEFLRRRELSKYKAMLKDRIHLPIYSHKDRILEAVRQHPVTILCAETGSGKTTQCSSYILEEALDLKFGDVTSILCTQPRRVAAISVAERVADEFGDTAIGRGLVGYQIRMETRRGPETRLLFCTTGVILRRLIEDPTLKGISHVVVDEVHERQWQIDVLLVALRNLLNGARPDLKVILMSATLDEKLFGTFFAGAPIVKVPGRTYPVATYYLEDLLESCNHVIENGSRYARRDYSNRATVSMNVTSRGGEKRRETADYEINEDVSDDYPGYGIATRRSMDRVDETVLNYDLIEDMLSLLLLASTCAFKVPSNDSQDGCNNVSNGAVLIFMPGIGEIRTLVDRLAGSKAFGNIRQFDVIPLHSTLSSAEQKRAFLASPQGCRKIIISTNVAETSVTIPDVVFVIDSGRVRELQRDKRTGTRKLVATWCSRASVKQRSGRAGRVQAGICLKLYSSKTENNVMKSNSEPELRRIPLEEVCLTILAGGLSKSCTEFLSQTPQPPDDKAVAAATKVLEDVGALVSDRSANSGELLTALGQHLAKLPVDARVGKMLIFGSVFKCIDSILTIASSLSASKSPFASSFDDGQQMKAAHAQFHHPFSDFLTLVRVWEEFRRADQIGSARKFCREKFLNYSALREIQDARYHYLDLLCGLGFIDRAKLTDDYRKGSFDEARLLESGYCRNSMLEQVVHAVVCAGLNPNVAHLVWANANGEVLVSHKTEKLAIQSSVNSKLPRQVPSSWVTFFEKFATERRTSISKTAFVSPFCLLLFGSDLQVLHSERRVLIDNWILIPAAAKTGVMFRTVRDGLNDLVTSWIENSGLSDHDHLPRQTVESVIDAVVRLLVKA